MTAISYKRYQGEHILDFRPHWLVRNPHLQTALAKYSSAKAGPMMAVAQSMTLTVEADNELVRLVGAYSPQSHSRRRGIILMLHGWLGCIDSSYMIGRGEFLYQQGYSIFRLNMRDHGDTMHLNEGIFHGCRLEEVFQAADQVANLEPNSPLFIVGFSMGGNFALRIAWRHSEQPLSTLRQVVAISPSIDPAAAVAAVDQTQFYRYYFRQRWLKDIQTKQTTFPQRYDFSYLYALKTCNLMTEAMVKDFGEFPNATAYYTAYAFTPDQLKVVNIPTVILTAADDPIIPIASFQTLVDINPQLTMYIVPHGGHVGFVDLFPRQCWLDEALAYLVHRPTSFDG